MFSLLNTTFRWIKPLCHPECVRNWLRFSSEHPLCHEALKQTLMVQTITRAFPDMCVYTSDWLQFSLACPTRVSLKGSGCVCVCWLPLDDIITCTAHADCYHKLFPVYSPWLSFFQRGREHRGVGLSGNWLQVLKFIRSGKNKSDNALINQAPMMLQASAAKIWLMVKHKFNHFLTAIGSRVIKAAMNQHCWVFEQPFFFSVGKCYNSDPSFYLS